MIENLNKILDEMSKDTQNEICRYVNGGDSDIRKLEKSACRLCAILELKENFDRLMIEMINSKKARLAPKG